MKAVQNFTTYLNWNFLRLKKYKYFWIHTICRFFRAEDESKCQCGVFKSPKPEQTSDTPVASKSPKFDLDCEKEGAENCLNMCKALAEASKEEGPQKLCDILDNTEDPFVVNIQ